MNQAKTHIEVTINTRIQKKENWKTSQTLKIILDLMEIKDEISTLETQNQRVTGSQVVVENQSNIAGKAEDNESFSMIPEWVPLIAVEKYVLQKMSFNSVKELWNIKKHVKIPELSSVFQTVSFFALDSFIEARKQSQYVVALKEEVFQIRSVIQHGLVVIHKPPQSL